MKYPHKFTLYFPSRTILGDRISHIPRDAIVGEMTSRFGGVTCIRGEGGWRDADGKIVTEEVELLTSCSTTPINPDTYVEGLLFDLDQDSIAYELDGVFYTLDRAEVQERRGA